MNNWIDVNERLPTLSERVLIFDESNNSGEIQIARYICDPINGVRCYWGYTHTFTDRPKNVIYWKPLPRAPKYERKLLEIE